MSNQPPEKQPKLPTPLMTLLGLAAGPPPAPPSVLTHAIHMSCNLSQDLDERNARIRELEQDAKVKGAAIVERTQEVTVLREKIRELEGALAKARAETRALIEQPTKSEVATAKLASERYQKLQRFGSEITALVARFKGSAAHELICTSLERIRDEVLAGDPLVALEKQVLDAARGDANGAEKG